VYTFQPWQQSNTKLKPGRWDVHFCRDRSSPWPRRYSELSTSYYDLALSGEIFSPLALRNDTIFQTMLPDLAAGTPAPGWSLANDKRLGSPLRTGVTGRTGSYSLQTSQVHFRFLPAQTFDHRPKLRSGIIGGIHNVDGHKPNTGIFPPSNPLRVFRGRTFSGDMGFFPTHPVYLLQRLSKIKNSSSIGLTRFSSCVVHFQKDWSIHIRHWDSAQHLHT